MRRGTTVADTFRPLAEAGTQTVLTDGVQIADILAWVLQQYGQSEVWQTSFSISEEYLRRLGHVVEHHPATIHLVLDRKATQKTIALLPLIEATIASCHLADNHSKAILVEGEHGQHATIVTSQNLTRGNRHEAYVITTREEAYQRLLADIHRLVATATPLTSLTMQNDLTPPDPNDRLALVEHYASLFLPISDIALLIGLPADDLRAEVRSGSSPIAAAYRRGKTLSRVRLHEQEMRLAQIGAPQAIENAHRNLMDMEDDE